MAKTVLLNCAFILGGFDFSDHVSKIEITDQFEEKEVTNFSSGGAKEVLGGLESYSVAVTFKQDYSPNTIDDRMWTLFRTRAPQAWSARAVNALATSANPQWSGNALIPSWKPLAGSPGDVAEADVTLTGSGVLTRVTGT